ncbi:hypothetical protein [Caulobacter sp. NIBR2454]|uniref:hypothetical protein n=1 Tax=Caulobacter sp. NIBR2454 TaxID=3015996 RepID=UPI0022B60048|nr:hypothetical protein [Caulobacter sp. NIBR2454]
MDPFKPTKTQRFLYGSDNLRKMQAAAVLQQRQRAVDSLFEDEAPIYKGVAGPDDGSGKLPASIPMGQRQPKIPSLEEALPRLAAFEAAGGDSKAYLEMLKAVDPDIEIVNGVPVNKRDRSQIGKRVGGVKLENVNGFMVDPNDEKNVGAYMPDLSPGEEPLYNAQGQVVGVRNMSGAIRAIAERKAAEEGATQAARAPYDFIDVPTQTGAPRKIAKSLAVGGDFSGQSKADETYAVRAATNQAEREAEAVTRGTAATQMLPTLDNMESLLPDVIAGFGADLRLNAARAMALAGDDGMERKVTATQTFKNEARQIVSKIIKAFGSNPTEGERKYAEQMAGADVELTPQALKEGIRLARERANRDIQGSQQPRAGARPTGQVNRAALEAEARKRGLIR